MTTQEKVQVHLDYLIEQGYNKDRILGVFLYGSQNYNLDTKESDVDTHAIILPSFEEMCLEKNWLSEEYHLPGNEHLVVKDIRECAKQMLKQNINVLEILFTEYKWVNPKYEELFNIYFINNRETIARYNVGATVKSVAAQALHTYDQLLNNEDTKKVKKFLFFGEFLNRFYEKELSYEECLKMDYYARKTCLEYPMTQEEAWDGLILLQNELKRWMEESKILLQIPPNPLAKSMVDEGVVAILKHSFSNPKTEITYHNFLNKLTNTEERALVAVARSIGVEGNITISKLVDETHISRPVYNNLLIKLKENNVAEVNNMGMKGTYIKFTHTVLKAKILEGEL